MLLATSRPLGRRGFQVFGAAIIPFLLFDIYACPVKGVLTAAAASLDAAGNILFMLLCAYCERQMMLMEHESDDKGTRRDKGGEEADIEHKTKDT